MTRLQKAIQDYLSVRRAVGYRLKREGSWLPDFASFLEQHGSEFITTDLALKWATQSPRSSTESSAKRLGMVRGLARHLHADDPRTEIPALDLLRYRRHRYTPYVYSVQEIEGLIQACYCLKGALTPHTYATLLGLLAVTGMRIGEAISLDRSDIDEHECLITIRRGKLGKSRELPVHVTTIEALRAYAKRRDRLLRHTKSPSFFLSQRGKRLSSKNAWTTFDRIRRLAGLERPGMPKPRIHDLRHTFAVRTLSRWYNSGSDVEPRLALLSTYLGHVSPSSTYWYLTGTPELLALAAKRLEESSGGF